MLVFNHMASARRRTSRTNPLKVTSTPKRPAPKTAGRLRTPIRKLPWWKRIIPPRKDGQPRRWSWRTFGLVLGGLAIALLLTLAGLFAYYVKDLPNPRELTESPRAESTKLFDRNGKQIYSFYDEQNRTIVTNENISDYVKKATISLEDASFATHPGFSVKGITRAIVCRIWPRCGRESGGGSTITQQFIKNVFYAKDRTSIRKVKEIILAIEVEQTYSKDEILTGYLNQIPYGANAYGIEAAAQTYFAKPAKELTLSEAATLAGIPQRPTYYSPYGNNLDALFARKDFVLDRMVKTGAITAEEAVAAKAAAPNAENPNFAARTDLVAPHFVFYVREKLLDYLGSDPKTAELALDQAGYQVYTSLDLETQALAESVLKDMGPNVVTKYQASNAAITAIDPKSGEILAMVGSIDYNNSTSGKTNFANAELQPGSSFKPLVYATEFNKDHKGSPASITYDLSTDFGGGYTPNNYNGNFSGPITNRNALARSLNIPAVKNLALASVKDSIVTAQNLGITTLDPKGDYGLSLVLGSGEVRPVEMAGAYGTFGNGGFKHELRPILKITKGSEVVHDFTADEGKQAIEPEVAFQISNILSDNSARAPVFGTNNNLTLGKDRPVAAKSGTTQNNRDAWTVGYTPQVSVAVWVGNNLPNKSMVKGADGSIVAAPIWNRFMREYLKGKPVENFAQPESVKQVTVDRLSGKLPSDQSPPDQRITDFFAPWQVPTEFDDVHVKVRIDRATGKLATDLTPPENVEEKYFCRIHSEQPNNPNWENPVQAWARANGCGDSPPTESDDLHTEGNRPTVGIDSPTKGQELSGAFTIKANPGGNRPISSVAFYVNSVQIGVATQSPWTQDYNADQLPDGTSIIEVVAKNDLGLSRTDQVTVSKASNAPGAVSAITHLPGKFGVTPIKISWKNPSNGNPVEALISQTGPSGTSTRTLAVSAGSTSNLEVTGPAGTYTFTIRVRNAGGVEGPTSAAFTQQMLP